LQEIQPHGPYYLGGWSMGGVVAWEMARQLQTLGQNVELLALIDSYVPSQNQKPIDDAFLINALLGDLAGIFGTEFSISTHELHQLQPSEQLGCILTEAKRLNILPREISLKQVDRLFEVFKANLKAIYDYQPQPYWGRVALFSANELEEDRGWSSLVTGKLETYMIPGDHYGMMRSPHVWVLAQKLGACLN
ncbi:thioesterase domain-containing protein, partial [Roseofilum sp. Guam]|uniref:thioesterase domain-containing protein n=1 Tax=Roseofilum sp. Guam TaxID=2821502 RepID=UPI001B0F465B